MVTNPTPLIFSFTPDGEKLGIMVNEQLKAQYLPQQKGNKAYIEEAFKQGRPLIGICATGIIIRILAPLLANKYAEPPVICVSEDGDHVIPLLGGHQGANKLASEIAEITKGNATLTNASEMHFGVALDTPPKGYILANPEHIKGFVKALLTGEKIQTLKHTPWLQVSNLPTSPEGKLTIELSNHQLEGANDKLIYVPQNITVGVGCSRGAEPSELIAHAKETLDKNNLNPLSIAAIASIGLKADEPALAALSHELNAPLHFFNAEELQKEAPRLKTPSKRVFDEVGCEGVAEGAALAAAGPTATLIHPKTRTKNTTCALAQTINPITTPKGQQRGKLSIVGIGPGCMEWRNFHALNALNEASEWVGYGFYLDLIKDIQHNQTRHDFALGEEEKRSSYALELAGQGKNVALVCSGDANIYAMGALVCEILERGKLSDQAKRVELDFVPGVSAFQAAAARTGALIGHDFCAISLSDLHTPWPHIENKLEAAAAGDFIVALYNPRSMKRIMHLERAVEILQVKRPPTTPVVIASQLGRKEEKTKITTLGEFNPNEVDMLTIVLIGASYSRIAKRANNEPFVYTPRGYQLEKNNDK